jgi:FtsZ-interacting cell division protein YlmF
VDIFDTEKKGFRKSKQKQDNEVAQDNESNWNTATLYEVAHSYVTNPTVALCRPRCMGDIPHIAEQMQGKFAVLLSLEHLPCDLSNRILDTVSGIAYGLDYQMTQVSSNCYLILPNSVELIGGELAI